MKSAVITFPGSNCDRDSIDALIKIGSEVEKIWYKESKLSDDLDLIIIPGGFSYGDYLRSGGMASISPIISEVKRLSKKGIKILGICNGFQILTEANLLDGALLKNKDTRFICKKINLRCANQNTDFTNKINKILEIQIAHMNGNYFCDQNILKSLQDNNQIAFQYCDKSGNIDKKSNPNGSINNIAGIFNNRKNILGMMPHPERSIDNNIGNIDGLYLFNSLFES